MVVLPSSGFVVEFLLLSEVSCRGDSQEMEYYTLVLPSLFFPFIREITEGLDVGEITQDMEIL